MRSRRRVTPASSSEWLGRDQLGSLPFVLKGQMNWCVICGPDSTHTREECTEVGKIENYHLDGVRFFEMEMVAGDPVVFAHFKEDGVNQPDMFLRAMNYYLHTNKGVGITGWRWLDHDSFLCEKWLDDEGNFSSPATPDEMDARPCKCLQRNFDRCDKGSLNSRRKRDKIGQ